MTIDTKPDNGSERLCLYRTWTHSVNGLPRKAQGCYPGNSGFINFDGLKPGDTVTEPTRSADGKFHKFTVVKCKYPECI